MVVRPENTTISQGNEHLATPVLGIFASGSYLHPYYQNRVMKKVKIFQPV